jgi:hypothetical protein
MHFAHRLRIPALFCSLSVLICDLIARPFAAMGVGDDGPYILMAQHLAATGHIAYNGWAAAMIVAQLYLGAAFIKLFGFSYTTVRSSTVFIAMIVAFVLQRTLVRAHISERNATFGTLALVLSPLYLMLSATFMSDITGLLAVVLCVYGCLRALQTSTDSATIAWLCFAIFTNVVFGTSRQIAWLGILVMVPSTLWLLRARRRVFFSGAAATLAGALLILACLQWLKHQPYVIPVPVLSENFPVLHAIAQLILFFLDIPFLLLPIVAMFVVALRKASPRTVISLSILLLVYFFLAIHPGHLQRPLSSVFEPSTGDWVSVQGFYTGGGMHGHPPIFLNTGVRALFTFVCFAGLAGLVYSIRRFPRLSSGPASTELSWWQLGVMFVPFTLAYVILLVSTVATTHHIFDRYALGMLIVPLVYLLRYYQERIQPQLPLAMSFVILAMAIYGVAVTYNTFSFHRARVAVAAELAAKGIPPTSLDDGWEYNFDVELQHADHLNAPWLKTVAAGYTPIPKPPYRPCPTFWYDRTPHVHPVYVVSFDPNDCSGAAPFAPVHFSRWPYRTPGTLYVARY